MKKMILIGFSISVLIFVLYTTNTQSYIKVDNKEINEVYMEISITSEYLEGLNINLSPDTPFSGILNITNGFPIEQAYGVIFLLNDTQISYLLRGKLYSPLIDLEKVLVSW